MARAVRVGRARRARIAPARAPQLAAAAAPWYALARRRRRGRATATLSAPLGLGIEACVLLAIVVHFGDAARSARRPARRARRGRRAAGARGDPARAAARLRRARAGDDASRELRARDGDGRARDACSRPTRRRSGRSGGRAASPRAASNGSCSPRPSRRRARVADRAAAIRSRTASPGPPARSSCSLAAAAVEEVLLRGLLLDALDGRPRPDRAGVRRARRRGRLRGLGLARTSRPCSARSAPWLVLARDRGAGLRACVGAHALLAVLAFAVLPASPRSAERGARASRSARAPRSWHSRSLGPRARVADGPAPWAAWSARPPRTMRAPGPHEPPGGRVRKDVRPPVRYQLRAVRNFSSSRPSIALRAFT